MEISLKKQFNMRALQSFLEGSILALLALVIYLFTVNTQTRIIAFPILLFCLFVVGGIYLYSIKFTDKKTVLHRTPIFKILTFVCISSILLWVGVTGWYVSPFFYLLYLVAVSLAFLFNTSVAFSFVLVLIAILLPQIGGVDTKIDIISLASLFLIVPLSYFLRREYIKRIEDEKKILVLEKSHKSHETQVEKILANKVTELGTQLREPINDIRQLALFAKEHDGRADEKDFDKIIISTARAFDVLNEFEQETTGKRLVRSLKKR